MAKLIGKHLPESAYNNILYPYPPSQNAIEFSIPTPEELENYKDPAFEETIQSLLN